MEKIKRRPTTVYLIPKIAQAAKVKAAVTGESVSDQVNEALARRLSQDADDLRVVRERRGERGRDFEDVLKDLKKDGLI